MILKHMASEQTPKFGKVHNISEIGTLYVLMYASICAHVHVCACMHACMYNEWSN